MSTVNKTTVFTETTQPRRLGRLFPNMEGPMRWTKRVLTGLAVIISAILLAGAVYQFVSTMVDARNYPAPGQMVDVGGYDLHLYCMGEGPQTVVLEAGLGGGVLDWSLVQPEIAKTTRVCSYDHAGAGWSEAGIQPRDNRQIVQELRTLLKNAGLQPPFVLAGHSLGGATMQLYASQYPEEVAGVVLVDSSHENQLLRKELPAPPASYALMMKALAPIGVGRIISNMQPLSENVSPELKAELAALYSHTGHLYSVADEFASMAKSFEYLRAHSMQLGDKPLIVLTHGKPQDTENAERAWQELQADLASRSSNGTHIIAKNSGHYIQFDEPNLVIDSILQVVNAVSRS
jgi:pimeloyl-ACP methyl ester carboxylesterase